MSRTDDPSRPPIVHPAQLMGPGAALGCGFLGGLLPGLAITFTDSRFTLGATWMTFGACWLMTLVWLLYRYMPVSDRALLLGTAFGLAAACPAWTRLVMALSLDNSIMPLRDLAGVGIATAILAGLAAWSMWWLCRARYGVVVIQDGTLCPACGYSLIGNETGRCPECGRAYCEDELEV